MTEKLTEDRIRRIIREEVQKLHESGLNRIHQHIQSHDCAIITGFRNDTKDFAACVVGSSTVENNKDRNRELRAYMLKNGYGVTSVKGTYIENYMMDNAVEAKEDSYFVVNLKDDQNFFEEMDKLAQHFCQDSVLIIPMEEQDESGEIVSDKPYLLGTNNSWPGLGIKEPVGNYFGGKEGEFMTRVRNRPFVFEGKDDVALETYDSYSRQGRWGITTVANRLLGEIAKATVPKWDVPDSLLQDVSNNKEVQAAYKKVVRAIKNSKGVSRRAVQNAKMKFFSAIRRQAFANGISAKGDHHKMKALIAAVKSNFGL